VITRQPENWISGLDLAPRHSGNNNNKEVARLSYAGARRNGYKEAAGTLDASGLENVPGHTLHTYLSN
jgi:hypothetical protein